MKIKDVSVKPLDFAIKKPDKSVDENSQENFSFENVFEYDEENPLTDSSLKERFFRNVSNNDSYNQMMHFDEKNDVEEIFDIIKNLFKDEKEISENNREIEINRLFKNIIDEYSLFDKYKNHKNLLILVFICFSEVIEIDLSVVFTSLNNTYKNILKDALKSSIGIKNYRFYEKRVEKNNTNLNNHSDVIIKPIL